MKGRDMNAGAYIAARLATSAILALCRTAAAIVKAAGSLAAKAAGAAWHAVVRQRKSAEGAEADGHGGI